MNVTLFSQHKAVLDHLFQLVHAELCPRPEILSGIQVRNQRVVQVLERDEYETGFRRNYLDLG